MSCNHQVEQPIATLDQEEDASSATSNLQGEANDSITIRVILEAKKHMSFNIPDAYNMSFHVGFENESEQTATIERTLINPHKRQILYYGNFERIDGDFRLIHRGVLLETTHPKVVFKREGNSQKLIDIPLQNADVTPIFTAYEGLRKQERTLDKKTLLAQLETLFKRLESQYAQQTALKDFNALYYYSMLEQWNPLNAAVERYLRELESPIASGTLHSLLFYYVKNRAEQIDISKFDTPLNSERYNQLLAKGVFNFLRHEDYKGDPKYAPLAAWLRTTTLYKENSLYLEKEITPLDNNAFKAHLKKLVFQDTHGKKRPLKDIITERPSDYYLLDFWATWCAPCIEGMRLMKNMDFPKNVQVISISGDRKEDLEKWVQASKELQQDVSVWLDTDDPNTRPFKVLIEMQSIPRYIVIDAQMNLIDQAFYHPHEPQFLEKLKDINNHNYW